MKQTQSVKATTQTVFNRSLKFQQKAQAAKNRSLPQFNALYDFPLMNLVTRLGGIKKQFTKIAFIGPNPDLFLLHIPKSYSVDKFYFVEQTEQQVQTSYDTITKKIENGFYQKKGCSLPSEIIPVILDEESWSTKFEKGSVDLIMSNLSLHWVNELESTLRQFNDSLQADGVFMGTMLGGDTLQELRICMNLAELERDGGVSPSISPMLSLTDMGNTFARCQFTMPTCDVSHSIFEFSSSWALFNFL